MPRSTQRRRPQSQSHARATPEPELRVRMLAKTTNDPRRTKDTGHGTRNTLGRLDDWTWDIWTFVSFVVSRRGHIQLLPTGERTKGSSTYELAGSTCSSSSSSSSNSNSSWQRQVLDRPLAFACHEDNLESRTKHKAHTDTGTEGGRGRVGPSVNAEGCVPLKLERVRERGRTLSK